MNSQQNSGLFALPGGHLEKYEEIEECAKRELQEEIGLTISTYKHFEVQNLIQRERDFHYVLFLLICQMPPNQFVSNREEDKHEDWIWVDSHQLEQIRIEKKLFNSLEELTKNGTQKFFDRLQQ